MNHGHSLFSQLISFANQYDFNECVERYDDGTKVRKFSYWDQFLCMSFAQLTHRESLRDIETCLRGNRSKLYHLGFRGRVSRSTLAEANENRDSQIFGDFCQILMRVARLEYAGDGFSVEIEQACFAFDSTTVLLCFSLFPWAQFDSTRSGLLLGTLLDLRGNIPSFLHISTRKESELVGMDAIPIEPGAMYIFDRGFFDWLRLGRIAAHSAHFVIRAKGDLKYRRLRSLPCDKSTGVRSDQLITPFSDRAKEHFPGVLRRITYFDSDSSRRFVFLTNNLILPPQTIAALYKSRWQIELFFKWIKQHLRIKGFFGRSLKAVSTQIWTAFSTYLLIAIAKKRLNLPHSLYTISQLLSVSAFAKTPLKQALSEFDIQSPADSVKNTQKQLDLWPLSTGQ